MRPYIFATLAMLFWGMSYVWTKSVFSFYEPLTVIFLRLFFASLIFLPVQIFFSRQKIARKDLRRFFILGLFVPFFYFIGENFGLKYISSTLGSLIIATIPLFTPVVGFLLYREKLSSFNIIGMLLSFLGITLMVFQKGADLSASLTGLAFMAFAVLSALGYNILIRDLSRRYSSLTITAVQTEIGMIYFLPFFLFFEFSSVIASPPPQTVLIHLGSLVVFASVLAFTLFVSAIRDLGMTKANIFSYAIPVFTAIAAYVILDETFSTQKIAGASIVISGLFLSEFKTFVYRKKI